MTKITIIPFAVCLIIARCAGAQQPRNINKFDLPNAPSVSLKRLEDAKLFTVSVGSAEKYSIEKSSWSTNLQAGLDYRLVYNKLHANLVFSHNLQSDENSVSLGLNIKLFKFGKHKN